MRCSKEFQEVQRNSKERIQGAVVSRYVDRFGTLKSRNLVTPQPWINIFQNLGNHCNLWNFATFRISLRMTEWFCPVQPRNFRNLATLLEKYFSKFTKIIVTFVTLQLLVFLRKLLNCALRNLVTSVTLQPRRRNMKNSPKLTKMTQNGPKMKNHKK